MPVDEFGREIPAFHHSKSSYHHENEEELEEEQSPSKSRSTSKRRSTSSSGRRTRAIERYVQEPMLCEYVWKTHVKETSQDEEQQAHQQEPPEEESYDDYRRNYCLNYIRAFFNQHMDDSWFRNQYSPLCRKRSVERQMQRAAVEAQALRQTFLEDADNFVHQARLGHGIKTASGAKRPVDANQAPLSHVLSITERTVQILDIPPHVTEEQILLALFSHTTSKLDIVSGPVQEKSQTQPMHRHAILILESVQAKQDLLLTLQKASVVEGHVPRKEKERLVELTVDCSDPYGRLELEDGTVPSRHASIYLSTVDLTPTVVVLSASLSSKQRMESDHQSALLLARALDVKHKIPRANRLDDLLESLTSATNETLTNVTEEDMLDITLAYLRRVHLFSFYNGCTLSDNLYTMLCGSGSTIHLRLQNADELLQAATDATTPTQQKDLLVQRLDTAIHKSLELCNTEWMQNVYISPEIDQQADEVERLQQQTERTWLQEHGSLDHDGRARCNFAFCRKLFKDLQFLEKHLRKKHVEFLKAEQAKCHDSFMMEAWDAQELRPVPPILVDCGSTFGLVASPIVGAEPLAADPEPDLWNQQEERRKRLEEAQQRKESRSLYRQQEHTLDDAPPPPRRSNNFVDVDDMVEEKVELSFENIEAVAIQPPKKKKKKRLL